ncbi:hypothetical protein [Paenibacillus sp. y28]|uniref:hypothetical protein n=1 Tax=Paenibacillus sp. y28 TaxID=3129110 RepID=UPI0030167CBD
MASTESKGMTPHEAQRREYMLQLTPFRPFLWLWGTVWMVEAVLEYKLYIHMLGWVQPVLYVVTALLMIVLASVQRGEKKNGAAGSGGLQLPGAARIRPWLTAAVPVIPVIVLLILLYRFGATEGHFLLFAQAAVISAFLLIAGLLAARELLLPGVLLFAITLLMGIQYLGYSPIVLTWFKGLSLITAAFVLGRRQAFAAKEEEGNPL